jgi:hypothetical protein
MIIPHQIDKQEIKEEIIDGEIIDEAQQYNQLLGMAIWISGLSEKEQAQFLRNLFHRVEDQRRINLSKIVMRTVYPEWKWKKIERWMEKRFERDMSITPKSMASQCIGIKRINSQMKGELIKLARKVKVRLLKRQERALKKILTAKSQQKNEMVS